MQPYGSLMRGRFAWFALAISCSAPAATPIPAESARTLRERMIQARTDLRSYVGEARLTYFGPDGRVKGTATLAVARPQSLRYEIQGPHGGVIEAFATDGVELQLLDFKTNRFIYGPASTETIDELLSFAPLGMDAREWVDLLCGDVVPPEDATVSQTDEGLRVRWSTGSIERTLYVNSESARPERMTAHRKGELLSDVRVEGRGERGMPDRLELQAPGAEVDMEIRLRDLTFDPELDASVFRIEAPASAEKRYLVGSGAP